VCSGMSSCAFEMPTSVLMRAMSSSSPPKRISGLHARYHSLNALRHHRPDKHQTTLGCLALKPSDMTGNADILKNYQKMGLQANLGWATIPFQAMQHRWHATGEVMPDRRHTGCCQHVRPHHGSTALPLDFVKAALPDVASANDSQLLAPEVEALICVQDVHFDSHIGPVLYARAPPNVHGHLVHLGVFFWLIRACI